MTQISAAEITSLARHEVESIADPTVRDALSQRLIEPELHLRAWDYGAPGERYPCWTVAKDPPSDSAIVYSVHGHGPSNPWGLVALSDPWFGMDSGWFLRLEDAFLESGIASALPIWDVVAPDGTAVLNSLSHDEAFARRDALDASLARPIHHVLYRGRLPGGIP
jgi:hypothetical protein